MGLSNFHSAAAEGVLPVLVMNTVLSVALLKNMAKSLLQVVGASSSSSSSSSLNLDNEDSNEEMGNHGRERRISITQFKSLCQENNYSTSSSSSSSSSSPCEEGLVPVPDSGACSGSSSSSNNSMECCVCLCGFEADEEVSELSCKHFFHKGCLEKWFGNNHTTCPLCRSIY